MQPVHEVSLEKKRLEPWGDLALVLGLFPLLVSLLDLYLCMLEHVLKSTSKQWVVGSEVVASGIRVPVRSGTAFSGCPFHNT